MHSFYSAHIFIVYNSVICTKSFNILILQWSYCFKLYSPFCVQSAELVCLYTLDIGHVGLGVGSWTSNFTNVCAIPDEFN